MGMVGGGRESFIGPVHRLAARLAGGIELVAGALSSSPERSIASGAELGLPPERNYATWQQMLERESALPAGQRIDFVSIVTPNHLHAPVAAAFAAAGFHVLCDKPLATSLADVHPLVTAVRSANTLFGVTYNYTGYPMVRQARALIASGALGRIRRAIVEYHQGWLRERIETSQKQAAWRTNPALGGPAGALGDIGAHAQNLLQFVTRLRIHAVCADLDTVVPGRAVIDDARIWLRLDDQARASINVSQICTGSQNDLRLRVWGDRGGLEWRQEEPESLLFLPADGPQQLFRRAQSGLDPSASAAARLPGGHPEAFLDAFANLYQAFANAIRAQPAQRHSSAIPGLAEGVETLRFIEAAMQSAASGGWTELPPPPPGLPA